MTLDAAAANMTEEAAPANVTEEPANVTLDAAANMTNVSEPAAALPNVTIDGVVYSPAG